MNALKDSEMLIALLAWKNKDITLIELRKFIKLSETEAREDELNTFFENLDSQPQYVPLMSTPRQYVKNKLTKRMVELDKIKKEITKS